MSPEEDRTRDAVDSEPKHYQLSYSGPSSLFDAVFSRRATNNNNNTNSTTLEHRNNTDRRSGTAGISHDGKSRARAPLTKNEDCFSIFDPVAKTGKELS